MQNANSVQVSWVCWKWRKEDYTNPDSYRDEWYELHEFKARHLSAGLSFSIAKYSSRLSVFPVIINFFAGKAGRRCGDPLIIIGLKKDSELNVRCLNSCNLPAGKAGSFNSYYKIPGLTSGTDPTKIRVIRNNSCNKLQLLQSLNPILTHFKNTDRITTAFRSPLL